ncbi:MAG: AmmeMemoRadiSam system protein B [Candidatus Magasanikbacteria bacterium]|nr:AmmeMemoRadiSam system protein B [Candidatus Magasanikbacteria bacterium]
MLVFAAITPHPPLLIPNIGKEQIEKVKKTKEALEQLEKDLYVAKPDLILIISPHASKFDDYFSAYSCPNFKLNFSEFGDFDTNRELTGSPETAQLIEDEANKNNLNIKLICRENLDHGSGVPLFYLTKHIENTKILPLGFCAMNTKKHLQFGEILKKVITKSNNRIAVIASGDLSHGLTTDAPAGFSQVGADFDKKIIELLETKNTVGITNMDPGFVENAAQCGYLSIVTLLGLLKNTNYSFKNYSYEGPFGVGYLVGNFEL